MSLFDVSPLLGTNQSQQPTAASPTENTTEADPGSVSEPSNSENSSSVSSNTSNGSDSSSLPSRTVTEEQNNAAAGSLQSSNATTQSVVKANAEQEELTAPLGDEAARLGALRAQEEAKTAQILETLAQIRSDDAASPGLIGSPETNDQDLPV